MKSLLNSLCVFALLVPAAAAQDADTQAGVEAAHEQYAEYWTAGDIEGLLTMYAEDAILWPPIGGRYQGTEEIREALEDLPTPTSATIEGTHLERMNGVVLDIGTFTAEVPDEAGGDLRGEYVVLFTETENGTLIQRHIAFPMREPPPDAQ